MTPKFFVIPALLLACGGYITVSMDAALAQSAPPRPTVATQIEPGIIPVDKMNDRIKDKNKRKQFEKTDLEKYGVASNIRSERGHSKKSNESGLSAPGK